MIVREGLNFERGMDPRKALNLGTYAKIKEWMDEVGVGVNNFKVNTDFTLETDMDIIAQSNEDLFPGGRFPEYIRFNTSGSFDIDDCGIVSLVGCPKYVNGYFSCQMNKIETLIGFPETVKTDVYCLSNTGRFTEQDIKEVCTCRSVEADDSEDP